MREKRVVVFCSASNDIDPKYNRAARDTVRALCDLGYGIVSGGSFRGTMGYVSDAVAEKGGWHKGVLPRFMEGLQYDRLDQLVWTDTMSQRKEEMRLGTVAAVILPGGIGTMDEFFETLTLLKLGRYDGRILALDLDGFYEPLKALLDHMVAEGMLDQEARSMVSFHSDPNSLAEALGKA